MAIDSNAFGSVILTQEDAKKFNDQVTYGRPKASAKESISRGILMAKDYSEKGSLTIKITTQEK